jgi:3-deoxy-D-manno-octulosonate 8-phosphate phosphatase (KDO 8-P phosphatase)
MAMAQPNSISFKSSCKKIKMLLFDCDGVLTDGRIILGSNGMEFKCFSTTDGMGLKIWRKAGFLCGSITGRSSEALQKRAQELNFDELHQGIAEKGKTLEEILNKRKISADEIAYIGDDINDLPIGTRVGLFFAPANHHCSIEKYIDYKLESNGGDGVIREVVEILLKSKGLYEQLIKDIVDG